MQEDTYCNVSITTLFYSFINKSVIYLLLIFSLCSIVSCSNSKSIARTKKKNYTIAIPSRWQHTLLYDADSHVTGFLSDFTFAFAQEGKFHIRLVVVDPENMAGLLENGLIDGCYTALPKTPISEKSYYFSQPILMNGTVVVVDKESPFVSLNDLKDKEIAFENSLGRTNTAGAHASWLLRPYESSIKALDDLSRHRLDGVILNYMQMRLLTKSFFESKFRMLSPPLTSQDIRLITFKKNSEDLVKAINSYLDIAKEKGSYHELLTYWSLDTPIDK